MMIERKELLTGGVPATMEAILNEQPFTISEADEKRILEELRKVTSPERVRDELYTRAYYRGGAFTIKGRTLSYRLPDIVAYPESSAEVQEILKIASKYRIPVTVVGTQTYPMGGRPLKGGLVLDVKGMKRIHKVDTEHSYVVVEPGVTVEELMSVIRPKGYMVATGSYPSSFSVLSTLTTFIAVHNMGNRMWDQVIGLEMVMPDGTTLYTGTSVDPDAELWTDVQNSFPGLTNLFRPSWTTIGVITKAAIRIWPLLEKTALPVFGFDDFEPAFRWTHAMSKSSMVDQTMVWSWIYVGQYEFARHRYLDYVEARMKYNQDQTPEQLNLFNCYAWAQMRGYKEEVEGAVETAKRLAGQYGGHYLPEEELQEKTPGIWQAWRAYHKEFWPILWGGPQPNIGPKLKPEPLLKGGKGEGPAMSSTWTGTTEEIIKMYNGLKLKLKEYGYKNWRYYSRMFNSGQTAWFRFFPAVDAGTQEEWEESLKMWDEIVGYVLENYKVFGARGEFLFEDPENPEDIVGRAKPIRRIMSAVQKEFDPEGIMNPVQKKYSLL